jgi:hypothetical protein
MLIIRLLVVKNNIKKNANVWQTDKMSLDDARDAKNEKKLAWYVFLFVSFAMKFLENRK